jgi:hypothetical protein
MLQSQARGLTQARTTVMRGVGRSWRGQRQVFVTLVRHTEQPLLALGAPIKTLALKAIERLDQPRTLREAQRQHLPLARTTAMRHHEDIRQQSARLTQGKKLRHDKLGKAYDPTLAPILTGKSQCPAPFGRKPGIASAPATGFIFATLGPQGNPSAPSYGLPWLDKVHSASDRVQTGPKRQMHSVASELGLNDSCLRQALQARGMLTVGIPKTIEPLTPHPSAQDVRTILTEAG